MYHKASFFFNHRACFLGLSVMFLGTSACFLGSSGMFLGCQACFLELQAFFLGSSGIFYFYFHVSFWVLALISKVQIQCNRLRVAGNLEHGNQVPINFYPPCHDMGSLLYTSMGHANMPRCFKFLMLIQVLLSNIQMKKERKNGKV